ncbi:TraL conjugative transposon family protein [Bacteroides uniformis]|uniref:DUF3989 domain-containing protein n=1 Tax=Bacteroides uniformis TaxID=820 RepID=A0A6I0LT40_BACUN|nr:TraL conjugative transposon family protein [Bacteroides uniformis]KAB4253861.1 DUF3989 domain-containing protein [Bacteroides uniformis]KAB4254062.1 DUF3989 domain-containing protein [Bacteroides uniformis]KAB4257630.1 DUF3989 domain-containing protein [Bacteroides uniformis]KAB4260425.1 DUF3989 domain-containing protein [Bacteroides uniformis]
MKKIFIKAGDFLEDGLRRMCGRLTPEKRVIAIVVMAVVFAVINFYMIFSAIYNIGREDAMRDVIEITPLSIPDIVPSDTLSDKTRQMEEFFNQLNLNKNDKGNE